MPSEEMKRLHSELEDLVNELWSGPRFGVQRLGFRPRIDVMRTESPDELRIVVDLAGVDPGNVQIIVHERALVIAGRRPSVHPQGHVSYHLMEIDYGAFERRLALPVDVDPGRARATYDRGLLVLNLPVASAPPPTQGRITITVRTSA